MARDAGNERRAALARRGDGSVSRRRLVVVPRASAAPRAGARAQGNSAPGLRRQCGNRWAQLMSSSCDKCDDQRVHHAVERFERHGFALVAAAAQHDRRRQTAGSGFVQEVLDQRRLAAARRAAHVHHQAAVAGRVVTRRSAAAASSASRPNSACVPCSRSRLDRQRMLLHRDGLAHAAAGSCKHLQHLGAGRAASSGRATAAPCTGPAPRAARRCAVAWDPGSACAAAARVALRPSIGSTPLMASYNITPNAYQSEASLSFCAHRLLGRHVSRRAGDRAILRDLVVACRSRAPDRSPAPPRGRCRRRARS